MARYDNNPINMVEEGNMGPIPYPDMEFFWLSFLRNVVKRFPKYIDVYVMLYYLTTFRGKVARELGARMEKALGEWFIVCKMERDYDPRDLRKLAKAVSEAFKIPWEELTFERAFNRFREN